MPITVKLSRAFYDRLGDEVANELVTLLNAADESYRHEFRDLFAANFGQVRAEMAELRAELHGEMGALRMELRGEMQALRAELRGEMAELRGEMRGGMQALRGELKAELDQKITGSHTSLRQEFNDKLHATERRLIGWMFIFWIGQVGVNVGLLLAARQLWR